MNGEHWRDYFDSPHLGSWDLPKDRDVVVTIVKVQRGELKDQKGRNSKKALIYFQGKEKALAANVTNCKTIAAMYGANPRSWVGKQIAMYVAENIDSPQGPTDAIRVRPRVPVANTTNGRGSKKKAEEVPPEAPSGPDVGDEQAGATDWTPPEPPPGALEGEQ